MNGTTIGIDLAKNVFQIHGTNEKGDIVLCKKLPRQALLAFFGKLAPCRIGMEACATAHESIE